VVRQGGVFRTNCIDCLDRTNVVQVRLQLRPDIPLLDLMHTWISCLSNVRAGWSSMLHHLLAISGASCLFKLFGAAAHKDERRVRQLDTRCTSIPRCSERLLLMLQFLRLAAHTDVQAALCWVENSQPMCGRSLSHPSRAVPVQGLLGRKHLEHVLQRGGLLPEGTALQTAFPTVRCA